MVEKSSTPVMVAHQLRHQNTYAEIKKAIEGGEIGEVESASFEWNYLLDREDPQNAWKLDPSLNGPTCLSDAGVHCVDLAIDLFGPGSIWGASARGGENEGVIEDCDILAVHSGVRVNYTVSRLRRTVGNKLFIGGTEGEIAAHRFFTQSSAPSVKITGGGQERIIEQAAGNPYRRVVEDFAMAAFDSDFVSVGTTLDEAVAACAMIDEAYEALGSPTGEWEPGSYEESGD
jgi:predicted dehydrogenase